jgi:hypothetical protein
MIRVCFRVDPTNLGKDEEIPPNTAPVDLMCLGANGKTPTAKEERTKDLTNNICIYNKKTKKDHYKLHK